MSKKGHRDFKKQFDVYELEMIVERANRDIKLL